MSEIVEWAELESGSSSRSGSEEFLRVKAGCDLKIRLIGPAVKVIKVWTNKKKCIAVNSEETGEKLVKEYPDMVRDMSVRCSCWCIDRDSGKLRILDMPISIARKFDQRVKLVGKKISTKEEGCDWAITTNGKEGKDVRYEAVYIEETPLTDAEIQMVKDRRSDKERHYDLRRIYRCVDYATAKQELAKMKMSM